MLIKIDKIAEHIMSLGHTDGYRDDSTLIMDRLVFGDLAPRVLALPVAHAIRGLTDESTPDQIRGMRCTSSKHTTTGASRCRVTTSSPTMVVATIEEIPFSVARVGQE
jgi:hypothetical protein